MGTLAGKCLRYRVFKIVYWEHCVPEICFASGVLMKDSVSEAESVPFFRRK
jgi:hypothetical protein